MQALAESKAVEKTRPQPIAIEDYSIPNEPFYLPVGDEILTFETACELKLPVMLKGPTGCGKTRFLEYMAWKIKRPLITIACHEDLTTSDLVGRYLLKGEQTVWAEGPLSLAVTHGAICYLDEVVEARKDTTVVIHPLTDDRRILPQEKRGLLLEAHPDFLLVISYNPGYQSVMKDLKKLPPGNVSSLWNSITPPLRGNWRLFRERIRNKCRGSGKTCQAGRNGS